MSSSLNTVDDPELLKSRIDAVMKGYIDGVYRWNATNYERKEAYKTFLKTFIQNTKNKDFREIGRLALEKHWKEYEKSSYFTEKVSHYVYRILPTDKHAHIYRLDARSVFYKFNHPCIGGSPPTCGYVKCSTPPHNNSSIISVACGNSCQMFFHLPCYNKHKEVSGILCTTTPRCFSLWISYQIYASSSGDFAQFLDLDVDLDILDCVESPLSAQGWPLSEDTRRKEPELRIARGMQVMRPQEEFEREAEIVRDILGAKVNDPNFHKILGTQMFIRTRNGQETDVEGIGSNSRVLQPPIARNGGVSNNNRKRNTTCTIPNDDGPFLTINLQSPHDRSNLVNASTESIIRSSSRGTEPMEIKKKNKWTTTTLKKSRGSLSRSTQFTSEMSQDKCIGTPRSTTNENGTETIEITKADAQTETFIRSSAVVGVQTGRVRLQDYLISNHQLQKLDEEFMNYRYEEFRSRSKLIKSAANTGLESGRIQVVRSNSLINAFRLMINELRGPQCVVSPMNTESLRSHLRIIVNYRNELERWMGDLEERCYALQGNEEFIQPILECSLEVILGLFPVPNPPEIDPGLVNRILSDMFMSGFLNYNDRQNSLIRELVEEGVESFPLAGRDTVLWSMYHIRRKVDYLDGLNMREILRGVLGEFTESVLRESRRVIVYID